jgi:hypothetical protein
MSFVSKGSGLSPQGDVPKVDSGQLSKLADMGLDVKAVANNPNVIANAVPVTKQVAPGIVLDGKQDQAGNFFVVDEKNIVHNIKPNTTPVIDGGFPTGGPLFPPSNGGGGNQLPPAPNPSPGVPPPSNLGSGRIWTRFQEGDIVPNQQETVTRALWSNNVGNLTTFYTSSAQNASSKRYYYEIFNSASGDCGSEGQFSVVYGHKNGSGSADEGGAQVNDTPTRAIYGQYKQLCLDPGTERFTINGSTTDSIYAINIARARMREYVDEGNLELNLQRLSGSQWLAGGGAQNAWTGSNVRPFPTQAVLRLIDDSTIATATVTTAGEVYNMVSGSLEDGVYNSSAPHYYGLLYRRLGIIVLDGNTLDMSASFLTVTGSEIPGDNAYKLFTSISASALYTDPSGDRLGFQGRSAEKVKSSHFFVRVKNQEYNFSNNPTFTTGSEGDLAQPTMIGNPTTFISTVGLYNDQKELLAVAKTSKPLKKNFSSELLLKIKLDF